MSDAIVPRVMEPELLSAPGAPSARSRSVGALPHHHLHHYPAGAVPSVASSGLAASRMHYRSRPVSVAVDPVSLITTECITITSAVQKSTRSQHSSVSAILGGGGSPHPVQLGPPSPALRGSRGAAPAAGGSPTDLVEGVGADGGAGDFGPTNRWGLRGKKGRSMQDNPLISGFGRLRHELMGVQGRARNPYPMV